MKTDTLFGMGEQVVVSIYTGDRDDPIVAKGEVVRRAQVERDDFNGLGIRFLSFAADGEFRIGTVVKDVFTGSQDM